MTRFPAYLSSSLVGGLVLLCAGCSTEDKSPLNAPAANGQPQPAQSQVRLQAPNPRSGEITRKLNLYRAQSLTVQVPTKADVAHSNVLYSAAVRHSVYMNTVNSVNYNPTGIGTGGVGVVTTAITPASTYVNFRAETTLPTTTSIFPALMMNTDIYARFAAVVGSPEVLNVAGVANEFYVFRGDVTNNGLNSNFRGYSDGDVIDSIWYSRRGRTTLMRPDLTYIGYGSVNDEIQGRSVNPPAGWEVLGGKLIGSLSTLSNARAQYALSVWPKDLQTGVRTYGTDTDLAMISGQPTTVRHQYAGPPIHVTLPTTEPFLLKTGAFAGGVRVGFRKAKASPFDPSLLQTPPRSDIVKAVTAIWQGPSGSLGNALSLSTPPDEYEYQMVGSTTTPTVGDDLRNGELILIPNEPLEPSTWYQVSVRLRTANYSFPSSPSESVVYTWHFQTDNGTSF
jgi:hypothetical protein